MFPDPRLVGVQVTSVEISRDYRHAKVRFSMIGDEGDIEGAAEGLASASGRLRRMLADQLRLQHTPELHFLYDPGPAHADAMERIFREIRTERPDGDPEEEDDE
ncbi:MAG: 30S ribosome-binding factor RbfA [Deltaproteobacteria bacterium]|nr:30S ribosome-binding factor RbfA [Deltaproteobacteria bacterium]